METYRHVKKNPNEKNNLNLDLTKAKSLQEKIAKSMIEGKQTGKSSVKILELEEKNTRLVELVQKIVEENKTIRKNFILVQESFAVVCDYNKKLASLVQSLKERSDLQKEDSARSASVFNFFRELYKVHSEGKWQPVDNQKFFSKIFEALQRSSELASKRDSQLDVDPKLFSRDVKNFSMFNTI